MKNYIILIAILFTQNVIAQNANTTKQEVNIDVTITYENEQDNIKQFKQFYKIKQLLGIRVTLTHLWWVIGKVTA